MSNPNIHTNTDTNAKTNLTQSIQAALSQLENAYSLGYRCCLRLETRIAMIHTENFAQVNLCENLNSPILGSEFPLLVVVQSLKEIPKYFRLHWSCV